jgi:hypothetical protein
MTPTPVSGVGRLQEAVIRSEQQRRAALIDPPGLVPPPFDGDFLWRDWCFGWRRNQDNPRGPYITLLDGIIIKGSDEPIEVAQSDNVLISGGQVYAFIQFSWSNPSDACWATGGEKPRHTDTVAKMVYYCFDSNASGAVWLKRPYRCGVLDITPFY